MQFAGSCAIFAWRMIIELNSIENFVINICFFFNLIKVAKKASSRTSTKEAKLEQLIGLSMAFQFQAIRPGRPKKINKLF